LIVTHTAAPAMIAQALSLFAQTGVLIGDPVALRIEEI